MRHIGRWIGGLVVVMAVSVAGAAEESTKAPAPVPYGDDFYEHVQLLADAVNFIRSDYVDEVQSKDLIYGALKGMLMSLDPHSQFMDPDTYDEVKVETEGEFGGLGIEITIRDDLLTVITPIDDTPAERAGLKAGDHIVRIDGESTKDITLFEAVKKLRGKPGTKVTLTVLREVERKLMDYTITRDVIKIQSVKDGRILDDRIGYIRLTEFQENTPRDLDRALAGLHKEGMDGLILDLRNNPGGLLNVAVDVADRFLGRDKLIVYTKGRMPDQELEFQGHSARTEPNYPLVVLINGGSASGSEIVAGAMKDHRRGIILGTKSFGKGSVQTIIPLRDGSALRLTTSKYYTPKGTSIHGIGIEPDVVVELEETVRKDEGAGVAERVFEELEHDEQQPTAPEGGGPPDEGDGGGKPEGEAEDAPEKPWDNQIARAVDLLKGIRIYQTETP